MAVRGSHRGGGSDPDHRHGHLRATNSFTGRAYDNQGKVTIMNAKVEEHGVWIGTGGGDVAAVARPSTADASGAVRSTLRVSTDRGSMTAKWERSDDGVTWQDWMDMTFTRMS
jgi:hypothetical protein